MSKKAANNEAPVRVLKNGTCPNLSGKSTLSYRIGLDEAGQLMLQLVGNSNPGYFNNEWVGYSAVQDLLVKQNQGKAITSFVLTPLFRGKSTNSPSFLFAVLKHEGLVELSESKRRSYDRCSDNTFLERVQKLIDGKGVPATSAKAKGSKNNKGTVVDTQPEPSADAVTNKPATKPLFVLSDVPDNKPAKGGRPKKAQSMVAAQGDAVNPAEAQ